MDYLLDGHQVLGLDCLSASSLMRTGCNLRVTSDHGARLLRAALACCREPVASGPATMPCAATCCLVSASQDFTSDRSCDSPDVDCQSIPEVRGACCLEKDNRCIPQVTRDLCDQAGGRFYEARNCVDVPCGKAPPPPRLPLGPFWAPAANARRVTAVRTSWSVPASRPHSGLQGQPAGPAASALAPAARLPAATASSPSKRSVLMPGTSTRSAPLSVPHGEA